MLNTQQKTGKGYPVREPRCPTYRAFLRLTPDSRVRVFFLKRHLPYELIQRHFGKGHFEMPYSLELPAVVLLKLGIESYKIHSGVYPIQEYSDYISVDF